jgi:hypothetical protein
MGERLLELEASTGDIGRRQQWAISRRRVLQGAIGAAVAGMPALQGVAAQDAATPVPAAAEGVRVYPMPGTRTASPWTQISFRGEGLKTLSPIQVNGSSSGLHPGIQVPHSDGNGISWYPDFAFHHGEEVSVRTRLEIVDGDSGDFSFTCATVFPLSANPPRNERADETAAHSFRSRPGIAPPRVTTELHEGEPAPGFVFLAPKRGPGRNGALIVDNEGEPVWFFPVEVPVEQIYDFRVMEFQGEPMLVWWQGAGVLGHGFGHWVVYNSSYELVTTIRIGNGYAGGDFHDIYFTPWNTALIGTYNSIEWDLTAVEGKKVDGVIDNVIQEIDIPTGAVMFEWHSLDFVDLEDTYFKRSEDEPDRHFDYFHYNSIDLDADGNILVSARNTWALYAIDRVTGEVIWTMGGKSSDFAMGEGTQPAYQHDLRPSPNGELSLFDNGAQPTVYEESRGLVLATNMDDMSVEVVREYLHPDHISAGSQGNMQILPDGNVFIGWGSEPIASEFAADGTLLLDLRIAGEEMHSYRAYRFEWVGMPTELPAMAVELGTGGELTLYASWNGATELAAWQVLAGDSEDDLAPVGDPAPRTGFETTIPIASDASAFAVQALDATGEVLAASATSRIDG